MYMLCMYVHNNVCMHVNISIRKKGLFNIKAIISNTIHCISLLYKYIQIHSCNDENKIMMITLLHSSILHSFL